jgi:hypothetical protein
MISGHVLRLKIAERMTKISEKEKKRGNSAEPKGGPKR